MATIAEKLNTVINVKNSIKQALITKTNMDESSVGNDFTKYASLIQGIKSPLKSLLSNLNTDDVFAILLESPDLGSFGFPYISSNDYSGTTYLKNYSFIGNLLYSFDSGLFETVLNASDLPTYNLKKILIIPIFSRWNESDYRLIEFLPWKSKYGEDNRKECQKEFETLLNNKAAEFVKSFSYTYTLVKISDIQ